MARCLISFGANIGNPLNTIRTASDLLRGRLVGAAASYQLSRYFRTPPVGGPAGQPPFVNAVAALHTEQSAIEVWQAIRDVEQELGRQRDRRWEARRIDLDILLYDELRIWTPQLKIPHPRMCMRRFILVPALDVAPTWIDPVSGWSIRQLAASLQTGPGNLLLISVDVARHTSWLPEIARHTMAEYLPLGTAPTSAQSRWFGLISTNELRLASENQAATTPPPLAKLLMFLTPPTEDEPTAGDPIEWETLHHSLALSLRLTAPQPTAPGFEAEPQAVPAECQLPIVGPRYLLSGDNRAWAMHEIVSALEAMDCPVEPLADP